MGRCRSCLTGCCALVVLLLAIFVAEAWKVLKPLLGENVLPTGHGGRSLLVLNNAFRQCAGRDTSVWNASGPQFVALEYGLREHWRTIRDEIQELERKLNGPAAPHFQVINDLSAAPEQRERADADGWRMLALKIYGWKQPLAWKHLPKTAALLDALPFGLVSSMYISSLGPRTDLLPHRGDFKGVLRYHVGLEVPVADDGGSAGLRVSRDWLPIFDQLINPGAHIWDALRPEDVHVVHWREGESVLFDDTYVHDVFWPEGTSLDRRRVILFVDVVRPGCVWWLSLALRALGGSPTFGRIAYRAFPLLEDMYAGAAQEWQKLDARLASESRAPP